MHLWVRVRVHLRVGVEIMGLGKYENVGEYQQGISWSYGDNYFERL
jgi:hypothetical protein